MLSGVLYSTDFALNHDWSTRRFPSEEAEQDGDPNGDSGGVGFVFMIFFRYPRGIPLRSGHSRQSFGLHCAVVLAVPIFVGCHAVGNGWLHLGLGGRFWQPAHGGDELAEFVVEVWRWFGHGASKQGVFWAF